MIGSLGVRIQERVADTGMTTPDAPAVHRALRRMADAGVTTAVLRSFFLARPDNRIQPAARLFQKEA